MFELYNDLVNNVKINKKYYSKKILYRLYILKFIENKKKALSISCRKEYLPIVKILLKYPKVYLNVKNDVIQESINLGNHKIVKLLMKYKYHHKKIDITYRDKYSYTNVNIENALKYGHYGILKIFIKYININHIKNIYDFIRYPKIIKYLIKKGYNIFNNLPDYKNPLIYSIEHKELETAKIMIKRFPELINHYDNITLFEAVFRGYYKIVKLMLKYNKSIDLNNNNTIEISINCRHKRITKILKKYKKEYNYQL